MENVNLLHFFEWPLFFFKVVGITFGPQYTKREKGIQFCLVLSNILLIVLQLLFLAIGHGNAQENAFTVSILSYFVVSTVKYSVMVYRRADLISTHASFKVLYLKNAEELDFHLAPHFRPYKLVQTFMITFLKASSFLTMGMPFLLSCIDLWMTGEFTYNMPMLVWDGWNLQRSVLGYVVVYIYQFAACLLVSIVMIACDLYLYSSISQLAMQFDLLSRQIMALEPGSYQSEAELTEIAKHHEVIRKLADDINVLFTPGIFANLFSSAFIICFTLYQVVGDVPKFVLVHAFELFLFELKNVALVSFFGEKLIDTSENLFDVLCAHDWLQGSLKYKRQVLFMMMHTLRPKALSIPGVANVSMLTLKTVLKISYQMFTVLKPN